MAKKKKKNNIVAEVGLDGTITRFGDNKQKKNKNIVAEVGLDGNISKYDIAPVKKTSSKNNSFSFSIDDAPSSKSLKQKRDDLLTQLDAQAKKRTEKRKWWDKEDNLLENIGNVAYKTFLEKDEDKYVKDENYKKYQELKKQYEKANIEWEDNATKNKKYEDGVIGGIEKFNDTVIGNFSTGVKGIESTVKKILGQTPDEEDTRKDLYEKQSQKARQETTGVGGVALDVVGGVSRMLPQLMVGNPTGATALGFANYGGGAYNEAKNDGYSEEKATKYGLVMGTLEMVTEKTLGAFGDVYGKTKIGTASNEIIDKFIPKIISNKQVRNVLTQFGSEGAEEFLQEYIQNITKDTLLDDKGLLKSTWENVTDTDVFADALYSAFVGGITGSTMAAPGQIDAYRYEKTTGRNAETGLTNNEQAVVDKVKEQRTTELQKEKAVKTEIDKQIKEFESTFGKMTEAEKKGIENKIKEQLDNGEIDFTTSKLSKKELAKIEEQVREDLNKGNIDIDTIESTLLSEKTTQIKELEEKMNNTSNEQEKAQIQAQISELQNAKASELQSLLSNDAYLQKSYGEANKKKQKFFYETTGYESEYKRQLAKDFEKVANNTTKSHETFEMLSKIAEDKQTNYGVINNEQLKQLGYDIEGKDINGLVRVNEDGIQKVLINIDSDKAINRIIGHETTHLLEGTKEYTELQKMIKEYATTKGDYDTKLKEITKLYDGIDADIEAEVTSDLVGDYLFTDTDFVNQLSTQKPTIFQKIYNEIKHLYKMATAGSKEARQLEKVKKAFDNAYKQNASNVSEDTKYSLVGKENGIEVYETSEETKKLSYSERKKELLKIMKEQYAGRTAKFEKNGEVYYAFYDKEGLNKGVYGDNKSDKKGLKAKINIGADGNYIELAENSIYDHTSKEIGKEKKAHENVKSWDYFIKTIKSDGDYFDVLINVRDTENNQFVYDITLKKADSLPEQLSSYDGSLSASEGTTLNERVKYPDISNSFSDNIAPIKENVNNSISKNTKSDTKYSLSEAPKQDNQGRTLTKEQQEYFKDSQERDADGSLKEMYHGTKNYGFTVFDRKYAKSSGNFGTGIYFAPTQDYSNAYGEMYKVYLNIKNPVDAINKQRTLTDDQVGKLVEAVANNEDYGIENYGYNSTVESVTNDLIQHNNDFEIFQDLDITCVGDFAKLVELSNEVLGTNFDGIRTPLESIVFNSNQIKDVDNTNPTESDDIRMSLGNKDIAPVRGDVFGSDIKLQVEEAIAPLKEEITKLQGSLQTTTQQVETNLPTEADSNTENNEYAPLTEADLPMIEQQNEEAFRNIDESNIPMETEENINPEEQVTDTKSLFETRDYAEVGNRKVNAYQYDNPEVKPYFQETAITMLSDLEMSTKGERNIDANVLYETGGEAGVWGTKRNTTPDIAELLEGADGKYKLSYEDIRKGLNAIIEDHGAENIASAKRIEFYLDQRLRNGYTTIDGYEIPANQDYLKAVEQADITNFYNNIPVDESLIPIEQIQTTTENIAPVKEMKVNDSGQGTLDLGIVRKLKAPEGEAKNKDVEPIDLEKSKQLTIDGTEEDLVTKTKKELRKELLIDQNDFFIDALDNAKNRSMALMNNTDTIRNTELVFGRENAKIINEKIFQKEIDNEADSIAWQNQERQEIKDLGIKARSKESAAVQKYGEKQYLNNNGELVPYTDADLIREFSDVATRNKIKNAAKVIRSKYDNYIDTANGVLTKLGFDAIPKRQDYMRHFQELNDVFSKYGIPFNAQSMTEHVLPTDINGLTENWSPQKNYFANTQHRTGLKTTYDAITGIDGYIGGIANLIYHTEDIQRGRAFEELIRETYGEAKGWDNLENLPDELKQARSEKIQDNHLSNYAAWVHEWTNNVAGKKSKVDRSVESMFGRKAFSFLDNVRKQVGANMIGFNLSSSLTNLIAPVQAAAKTNKLAVLKGTADTIKNMFIKDNFMEQNKFLISRMGSDMISKNAWQKIQDAGFVFMKGMDWFSSNQIVRSKFYELKAKGMSDEQAHSEAGQFAARVLGDRTKGANAQLYNSKLIGLVTQFQLEVNNQLYSTFYDTYHESKENAQNNALKTAAGMTFTLGQLFAFTHLFGQTFESIAGYNPTMDIVEIIKTALGWGEDEDDEEKTTSERLKSAADQLVDSLPYVNILTGGGRIPIASGIPNLVGVATGGKDDYGNELTLEGEMKKLLYLIPPAGGNQFKKTSQGLGMFDEDLPVKGSYTDSGNLRFAVEDTPLNRIQAGIFGQYANENASNYFDNERAPLKEKQIQELADLDIPMAQYWQYREDLTKVNKIKADKDSNGKAISGSAGGKKAHAIMNGKYSDEEKEYLLSALSQTDEDPSIETLNKLNNNKDVYKYYFSLSKKGRNDFMNAVDEYGFSAERLYEFNNTLKNINNNYKKIKKNIDEDDYTSDEYNDITDTISKEKKTTIINEISKYANTDSQKAFLFEKAYGESDEVKTILKTGIGMNNYLDAEVNIASIKDQYKASDNMSSKQKTALSKQRKAAVQQYINSLNLSIPQKLMLEKMVGGYSIKKSEKYMFEYINSLNMSAEEKQKIHNQLF